MAAPGTTQYQCPACSKISDFSGVNIDETIGDQILLSMTGIGGTVGRRGASGVIQVNVSCPECDEPVPVRAEFHAEVKIKNFEVDDIDESSYGVVNNNTRLQDIEPDEPED